jgi:hypothetical protein
MIDRIIKFRVWNDEQKKFEYFELHNITVPDRLLTQYKFPVQQYTGLQDKNGKEIYEGDIIKLFNGDLYTVKFIEENNETEMSGYFFSSFGSEVIGNIFENNELLE